VDVLNTLQLLTAKPAVYLVNLTEKDYQRKKNKWLPKIFEWVQVGARSRGPGRPGGGRLQASRCGD
jgi:obg-like ATPase 1